MDINHCIENWDYTHFLAYVYVTIAKSDYEITAEQVDELHHKLTTSVFSEASYQDLYSEVLRVFNKQNDSQVFDFITALSKKHITSEEQKNQVLQDLHDIIDADGHESGSEQIMFMSIKKIFNSVV